MWTGVADHRGDQAPLRAVAAARDHGDRWSPTLLAIPLGIARRAQAGHLGRLRRARVLDRRPRHAVVLARHPDDPGAAHRLQVAAADGVHAVLGRTRGRTSPSSSGRRWPSATATRRWRTRMTRSAMLEVLREDYIRTARAKGLWSKLILTRHALKNAMLPVLTVIALEFAFLLGGLVVTEQVFNLNGLGLLFVEAIAHRDYTLTQALVLLVADGLHLRQLLRRPRVRAGSIRASGTGEPWPINARSHDRRRADAAAEPRARGWLAGGRQDFCAPAAARRDRAPRSSSCMVVVARSPPAWSRPTTRWPIDFARDARAAERRSTGSAPTPSAATCSRASSTARAPRSWSGFGAARARRHARAPILGVGSAYFGGRVDLDPPARHGRVPRRSR